jgi:hypothetical protein
MGSRQLPATSVTAPAMLALMVMVPALGRNAPLHRQRRHQGQQREDQCMRKRPD